MSNSVIQHLVTLENKPELLGAEKVKINFRSEQMQAVQQEKPTVKIVNKQLGREYRERILERLMKNKVDLPYVEIVQKPKPIVAAEEVLPKEPVKTGKRLIIKPALVVQRQKEGEEEEEKQEEEEQKEGSEDLTEDELNDFEQAIQSRIKEKESEIVVKEVEEVEVEGEELIGKEEVVVEEEEPKKKPVRRLKIVKPTEAIPDVDLTTAIIRTQRVVDRLPKEKEKLVIPTAPYYMNNRKIFIQKLADMFKTYREVLTRDEDSITCDSRSQDDEFDLLTHQRIVRDYLNLYTPYRGLLLYHGLGSGKTCTSIAIAEGMKTNKRVFVLTPASLKMNFFSEMKKCGDSLYKKNQYWEFVSIDGNPEYVGILSKALSLSTEYIKKHGGAWLVNINKESNYTDLESADQKRLDEQLNEMIRSKYTDINYNGLNMNRLKLLTGDFTHNPFDNAVVVIDEAHNFVSRIVNKVKKPESISYKLYEYLMSAKNARIVLLSGTPIINYPNEIGILFNILRGYIKTWSFGINVKTSDKITTDTILQLFDKENFRTYDYVEYNGNNLTITRNPFGFVNAKKRGVAKGTQRAKFGGTKNKTEKKKVHVKDKDDENDEDQEEDEEETLTEHEQRAPQDVYEGGAGREVFDKYDGVRYNDTGNISDTEFQQKVIDILRKNNLEVQKGAIKIINYKALPDDPDSFFAAFIDKESGEARNINLFQRRILGLTSYFRSAQEQLLPSLVKTEAGDLYHVEKIPMSDHQYLEYEKIRKGEAEREQNNKKKRLNAKTEEDLYKISSTYRIFSRAACNFVFPDGIERPKPNVKEGADITENLFDVVPKDQRILNDVYENEEDAEKESETVTDQEEDRYEKRIEKAMQDVNEKVEGTGESKYLSKEALLTFSPKFAKVLENIQNADNEGLHLLYSHFRTIEGIGILKLILEANGFSEFKIQKTSDSWAIVEKEEDAGKPRFVLYTGTETPEEKEIIRNVYNGTWDLIPSQMADKLRETSETNSMGEIIKIFMITSSGAEGINLRNTRFVHIIEPYWHMVRVDQVVGRARRICSHQELPEDMRTVKVYLYVTMLNEKQKANENKDNIELRLRDVSRIDKKTPVTTDETLYEMASIKQRTNNQILQAVKETAIDCQLYSAVASKKSSDDNLVCYGFGKIDSNNFASYPSFENDRSTKEGLDVETIKWQATKITEGGIDYALNDRTMEVYDLESYNKAKEFGTPLILVGKLVKIKGEYKITRA